METFVVRVFVPADHAAMPLAGTVEHVGAGRTSSFRGIAGLLDVVLRELQLNDADSPTGIGPDRPSQED